MELVEDSAMLYEVGVGKGGLIVSGLNHDYAAGRPENEWLLARLLEHAASHPRPKAKWPPAFLSAIANRVPGFHRLISGNGPHHVSVTYRDEQAPFYSCTQMKAGNSVTWETTPVPANLAEDHATFVFAGTFGYGSAPPSKGFALEINGKETLAFDIPVSRGWECRWQSADRQVELTFYCAALRPQWASAWIVLSQSATGPARAWRTVPVGRAVAGRRQRAMVWRESLLRHEINLTCHAALGSGK